MEAISRISVAGVPLIAGRFVDSVNNFLDYAEVAANRGGEPPVFRFVNSYTMSCALSDDSYYSQLQAGYNFPDGLPVAKMLRKRQRGTEIDQHRGPAFFEAVLNAGQSRKVCHFFLGTNDEVLASLVHSVSQRFPSARVAGTWAPPFRDDLSDLVSEAASRVASCDATVVWVALGTPKQDFFTYSLAEKTGLPCLAVGAAFEFSAGAKPTAPAIFQKVGAEWVFRLATEPRRLWRRYLIDSALFVLTSRWRS